MATRGEFRWPSAGTFSGRLWGGWHGRRHRWRLEVRASLRQIGCPVHGARTEGVPFAWSGSHFTQDFEDLVGWLTTSINKTALSRLVRIDWDTTGRIIERVMATGLDPNRLDNLFVAGADEVSWRKGHSYLTQVVPDCRN